VCEVVPLHLLAAGETGCVLDVAGGHPFVFRLQELGLRVGANVRMVQPGQPCIVALNEQRLSLRAEDEAMVLVEVSR
jgi:ferrous iron transport protein A